MCALLDNNKIKCWGGNGTGQLGQGNTDNIGDDAGEMDSLVAVDLGMIERRRGLLPDKIIPAPYWIITILPVGEAM